MTGVDDGVDSGVALRLLGPLSVLRDGQALPLPASRKARALLAYLAMTPRAVARQRLCELLWPLPGDPRAELRGCLSKLRPLLDDDARTRLQCDGDAVRLDLAEVDVDAVAVAQAMSRGLSSLPAAGLRALAARVQGEFLQGLSLDHCPAFTAWLEGQRRRWHDAEAALLEAWVAALPDDDDERLEVLERWLHRTPLAQRPQVLLLQALARRGDRHEGRRRLDAAVRCFEAEGLDPGPLVLAWRQASAAAVPAAVALQDAAPVPASPRAADDATAEVPSPQASRASIAVMPFDADPPDGPGRGGLADGLVHDVIVRLARLRTLFVTAPGSVFALAPRRLPPQELGRLLQVGYVATGRVQRRSGRVHVAVELVEARQARVVWTEAFDEPIDDALAVLDAVGHRIVASLAGEVEAAECERALRRPLEALDAWEAFHRGLWHMYRFRREDNEQARQLFDLALRLDPRFARAHAGRSFTHFQSAFQQWGDRDAEAAQALEAAQRSLETDERDPSAHWAMGRARWLAGQAQQALPELDEAVSLSPQFALGHYALAFVHSQSGDAQAAIRAADRSRELSPFDPLMFGMLGTRAIALVRLQCYEEAAEWALKAAARPNAHAHILALAAHVLSLAGRLPEARGFVTAARRRQPGYGPEDFHHAFRFGEDATAAFRRAALPLGW